MTAVFVNEHGIKILYHHLLLAVSTFHTFYQKVAPLYVTYESAKSPCCCMLQGSHILNPSLWLEEIKMMKYLLHTLC